MSATAPRGGSPDAPATRVGGRRGASQALLGPVGRVSWASREGRGGRGGADPVCRGGTVGPGCAVSGGWRRCCTFDRDRPATDRRNHAETPRRSTPLKSSHVQRGRPAHGSPPTGNQHSRKSPGIVRKLGVGPRGQPSPMCNTTARAGKSPARPGATLRQSPSGRTPPGARPRPNPAGGRPHHADTGPPTPAGEAQCTYRCVVLPDMPPGQGLTPAENSCLNAPTGAWCSLTWGGYEFICSLAPSQCTYRCVVLPDPCPRERRYDATSRARSATGPGSTPPDRPAPGPE